LKGLLLVSGLFFLAMGSFAHIDFLLPGIVLEVVALIGYFVLLIKESK
jgi:hypothetical protein